MKVEASRGVRQPSDSCSGQSLKPNGQTFGPIGTTSGHLRSKTGHFKAGFQQLVRVKAIESSGFLERAMGIEPTSEAWEALNNTPEAIDLAALSFPCNSLNWKPDGN